MYYFTYRNGKLDIHYEYCDRDEVVDSFTVLDLEKINKWCDLKLPFPYEINRDSIVLLLSALVCKSEKNNLLNLFQKCVLRNEIKIYCEVL